MLKEVKYKNQYVNNLQLQFSVEKSLIKPAILLSLATLRVLTALIY